jgi:hypothetical protein
MRREPDKQPEWVITVRDSNVEHSFTTGSDGAGHDASGVISRDQGSDFYDLRAAGFVSALTNSSDLQKVLGANLFENNRKLIAAAHEALGSFDNFGPSLNQKPIVRELCSINLDLQQSLEEMNSEVLRVPLGEICRDENKAAELLALCIERIDREMHDIFEIERAIGFVDGVKQKNPIKTLFAKPFAVDPDLPEIYIRPFRARMVNYGELEEGSSAPKIARYCIKEGSAPSYVAVLKNLCGSADSRDGSRNTGNPLTDIKIALALLKIGKPVCNEERQKIDELVLLDQERYEQKVRRSFFSSIIPATLTGASVSWIVVAGQSNWGAWLAAGLGFLGLIKIWAPHIILHEVELEDEKNAVKRQHLFDRRSLLSEVVLRFVDCFSDPERWDELIGSNSSKLWHAALFGRDDYDDNSLQGVVTPTEGRAVISPSVSASPREYQLNNGWIAESEANEGTEVVENSRREVVCLTHMVNADRTMKQIFSVFVGYSFARRVGLVRDEKVNINLLEKLLAVSQFEECDRNGNYPTVIKAFNKMLRDIGLSKNEGDAIVEWEAIAPALIAIEKAYRSLDKAKAQRIVQEELLKFTADVPSLTR